MTTHAITPSPAHFQCRRKHLGPASTSNEASWPAPILGTTSWLLKITKNRLWRLLAAPPKVCRHLLARGIYLHPSELENRETTLIEVVQSLGEYINDEDGKIRDRGVSYLTAIIASLPPTFLSRQQIDVLCEFLCARIEDGGAIEGLSRLQALDRFTNNMTQTVVKA